MNVLLMDCIYVSLFAPARDFLCVWEYIIHWYRRYWIAKSNFGDGIIWVSAWYQLILKLLNFCDTQTHIFDTNQNFFWYLIDTKWLKKQTNIFKFFKNIILLFDTDTWYLVFSFLIPTGSKLVSKCTKTKTKIFICNSCIFN